MLHIQIEVTTNHKEEEIRFSRERVRMISQKTTKSLLWPIFVRLLWIFNFLWQIFGEFFFSKMALFFRGLGLIFILKWFDLISDVIIDIMFLSQKKAVYSLGNKRNNLNVSFYSFKAWKSNFLRRNVKLIVEKISKMIFTENRLTQKISRIALNFLKFLAVISEFSYSYVTRAA